MKRMNSGCEDVGEIVTRRFAVASVKKDMDVTRRSKERERARKDGDDARLLGDEVVAREGEK